MKRALIKSLLIANRSEIAIRVMRAAAEMNIRTRGDLFQGRSPLWRAASAIQG